jgi:hypothetical protein
MAERGGRIADARGRREEAGGKTYAVEGRREEGAWSREEGECRRAEGRGQRYGGGRGKRCFRPCDWLTSSCFTGNRLFCMVGGRNKELSQDKSTHGGSKFHCLQYILSLEQYFFLLSHVKHCK